ncbi:hypothetical protein V7075_13610 [Neobacillus drentensis]|uniref:hypothetical protein n=1 Tax=Neobacillus drentensis TaxID=220684 RepID=UPI002FFF3F6B
MKSWAYTEDGYLVAGITENGLPYFEKKLLGWNDHKDPSNKEDLVVISAVIYDDGTQMVLKNIYASEEAFANPLIRKKGEEMEQVVLNEVKLWLNGAE